MIKLIFGLIIDFKTEIIPFLTALSQFVLQGIKKSIKEAHLDAKIYWISSATLWDSTTVITLSVIIPIVDKWVHENPFFNDFLEFGLLIDKLAVIVIGDDNATIFGGQIENVSIVMTYVATT